MKRPLPLSALPLSGLRAFEAAARTGSFRAAAIDLHLTPSAVSHSVRGLEKSLRSTMFVRDGRSIRLTPEGETLIHHVERAFLELQHGIAAISTRGPMLLRLHSAPSFAAQWLVPRLARFLTDRPGFEFRIAAGTDYTRFLSDEFDADIIYGGAETEFYGQRVFQGLDILPLGEETITPLCAPALAKHVRSVKDLLDMTLIESDNKKVRWPAWFAVNGLKAPPPQGPRFDRSFLSISAAADGLGIALESTRLAERELASGRLVRALDECEDVRYVGHQLVLPRIKRHGKAVSKFIDWLSTELALSPLAEPEETPMRARRA